jgi:hypothetical protein
MRSRSLLAKFPIVDYTAIQYRTGFTSGLSKHVKEDVNQVNRKTGKPQAPSELGDLRGTACPHQWDPGSDYQNRRCAHPHNVTSPTAEPIVSKETVSESGILANSRECGDEGQDEKREIHGQQTAKNPARESHCSLPNPPPQTVSEKTAQMPNASSAASQ